MIEDAVFAVRRARETYKCKGSNLESFVQPGDKLIAWREDRAGIVRLFPLRANAIRDTDIFACSFEGTTYKVDGARVKELTGTYVPDPVAPPVDPIGNGVLFHVYKVDNTGYVNVSNHTKITDDSNNIVSGNQLYSQGHYYIWGNNVRFDNSTANWLFFRYTETVNQTSMFRFLADCPNFTGDVSWIDTSRVTSMHDAFAGATLFDNDLSDWDVSSVTDFQAMFSSAISFNSDIGGWNVSKATHMDFMFDNRYQPMTFNQDISKWCVQNFSSEPAWFGTSISPANKPVWGTCPRQETSTFTTPDDLVYGVTVADGVFQINAVPQYSVQGSVGNGMFFDQTDGSNSGYDLRIYTDSTKTTEVTDGVTITANGLSWIPASAGTFSYQSNSHDNIGGTITVS